VKEVSDGLETEAVRFTSRMGIIVRLMMLWAQ